ncbi:MAG: hypothetical protein ACYT04_80530, partial [Nostoc sp.]
GSPISPVPRNATFIFYVPLVQRQTILDFRFWILDLSFKFLYSLTLGNQPPAAKVAIIITESKIPGVSKVTSISRS